MQIFSRKIILEENERFGSYENWQKLYKSKEYGCLIPNTEIIQDRTTVLKINSLGCRGEEIDPSKPSILFLGDSTTFSVSFASKAWPEYVTIPGYQILNAGVEGINIDMCVKRYQHLSAHAVIAAVVVYTGWHNIIYGDRGETYWRNALSKISFSGKVAFCSIATCLINECRTLGVERFLNESRIHEKMNCREYLKDMGENYFNFWSDIPPSLENINLILDGISRYNQFIKKFCQENGHIFIDLETMFTPSLYDHVPSDFYDVCHFRPSVYKSIGNFVANTIAPHISTVESHKQEDTQNDLRKNMYSIF